MVEAKDIVAISIPFSAGVASAAALSPGGETCWWAASASCLAAAVILCICCGKGKKTVWILSLFFTLGTFCYFTASLSPSGNSVLWTAPDRALSRLTELIDRIDFPHRSTSELIKALLTGKRDGLGRETVQAFRAAGAAHILALSGLHLGVIYALLSRSLVWLGHSRAASCARAAIIVTASAFYAEMTGASPSITRAFLFITINEAAKLSPGRKRSPLAVFSTALIIQLTVNPAVIKSLGFQLSYLAMLGIFTLFPKLDSWYPSGGRCDLPGRIWSATALTLSCQLFTAPLVWMHFHTFPKWFLLTNLVALPMAEVLIILSVFVILTTGLGCCPQTIKNLTDTVGQTLIWFLETLASIS